MFGRHGWARISVLYGFNTVVVVALLQVVVLMNETFPFDLMFCHGVHYFPHWMTCVPLGLYNVSHVSAFTKWLDRSYFFHHSYGCRFHGRIVSIYSFLNTVSAAAHCVPASFLS